MEQGEARARQSSRYALTGCACHSRRGMLAGLAALAGAAALPSAGRAQPAAPAIRRAIDTHHHIYPPRFTRDNIQRIVDDIGIPKPDLYLNWSPQAALDKMDEAGVETAINSITSPGVWFQDGTAGRARARECNEFGAKMMQDHPGRFGMFAAVPLPDTDGTLQEIAYAMDDLKLDGIGLLTSYAGKLLGDPSFAPVYEELNRRRAVVFVHPTMSCCANPIAGVRAPTIDFPMDTTRTIVSLLMSGTFVRYPQMTFIFSHGGGVLLPVVNRIAGLVAALPAEARATVAPQGLNHELQRHYYDLASIGANPAGMEGLRALMPVSQLLYGSDEPLNSTVGLTRSLEALKLPPDVYAQMRRGNALRLFPRLAG
jgi:predicted TIM-barrel fold metal-dependent hydrolase